MTQMQMAKALSINYNTYISYEYGYRNPSRFVKKHIEEVTRGLLNRPVAKASSILKEENNNGEKRRLW